LKKLARYVKVHALLLLRIRMLIKYTKVWIREAMKEYPDRVETTKTREQLEREVKYLETRKAEQENS
jgi:hypothetical protein